MKAIFLAAAVIVSLLVQVFFLQGWQVSQPVLNLVLALLVVACLFNSLEYMLWAAFGAGLFLDFYAHGNFGFNLGFYLLLIIVCKYLLGFGEREHSWWRPVAVVGVATFLQAVLYNISSLWSGAALVLSQQILAYVCFSMLAAAICYLILVQFEHLSKKLSFFKIGRK